MAWFDWLLAGRRKHQPERDTQAYPRLLGLGQASGRVRVARKPTRQNLRSFARTPFARRAINAIKNPITQLEWSIKPRKKVEENAELRRQIDLVESCFENPNADDSLLTLLTQLVEDICCGAGAIELKLGGDAKRPAWLYPVDGLTIAIDAAWDGDHAKPRYYQQFGYGQKDTPLLNRDLMYIRPNPSTATPFGLGPLEVAFTSIDRQLSVGKFTADVASNTQPNNILYLGEEVDDALVQAARRYWQSDIDGRGVMPILGGPKGMDVLSLNSTGDDAMYLKYQEFLIREIAASFDISPQNLSLERDVNRNTSETSEGRDWEHAIKPMARLIASHFTRDVIVGLFGFTQIKFVFDGLDQDDDLKNAEIFQIHYRNNAITPNEYRNEVLGLPPLESDVGDKLFAEIEPNAIPQSRLTSPVPAPQPKERRAVIDDAAVRALAAAADHRASNEALLELVAQCVAPMARPDATRFDVHMPSVQHPVNLTAKLDMPEIGKQAPITFNAPPVNVDVRIPELPAPVVNVSAESKPADVKVDVHVPEQKAPVVTVQVPDQPAPVVNVSPQSVAPIVNVTTPGTIEISKMPTRETKSRVSRDDDGNITDSTQIEKDV